jgi:hypothetical protein
VRYALARAARPPGPEFWAPLASRLAAARYAPVAACNSPRELHAFGRLLAAGGVGNELLWEAVAGRVAALAERAYMASNAAAAGAGSSSSGGGDGRGAGAAADHAPSVADEDARALRAVAAAALDALHAAGMAPPRGAERHLVSLAAAHVGEALEGARPAGSDADARGDEHHRVGSGIGASTAPWGSAQGGEHQADAGDAAASRCGEHHQHTEDTASTHSTALLLRVVRAAAAASTLDPASFAPAADLLASHAATHLTRAVDASAALAALAGACVCALCGAVRTHLLLGT